MTSLSDKRDYYNKVKHSNYEASLKLEGITGMGEIVCIWRHDLERLVRRDPLNKDMSIEDLENEVELYIVPERVINEISKKTRD